MTDGRAQFPGEIDGAGSVLVLAPSLSAADGEACIELLTGSDPAARNVLSVTLVETAADRLALWQRRVGEALPERVAILGTGGSITDRGPPSEIDCEEVTVVPISEQIDTLEIASTVGEFVGKWDGATEPTVVCVHSLTALLDRLDTTQVARLVATLNDRFEAAGATAHYHVDPAAHEDPTLAGLRGLFDAVVEHDPEAGWSTSQVDRRAASLDERRAARDKEAGSEVFDLSSPPESLDTVLDLLAAPQRRAVLYSLVAGDGEQVTVDALIDEVRALAARVGGGRWDASRETLELSFPHVHLPKLADAGVIEYDRDERAVRDATSPALGAFVTYVRASEGA